MANDSRTKFYLNRRDAKWKGVSAGIADYIGVEALWVRLGIAGLVLFGQQWWLLIAYLVVAWVAEDRPAGLHETPEDAKFWQGVRSNPKRSTAEVRGKFRELDRRLADIELHYTSRNTQLADEIERLR